MKKRFLALILGTVMTASLIVGCGGKSSGNSGSAPADADAARASPQKLPASILLPCRQQTREAFSLIFMKV